MCINEYNTQKQLTTLSSARFFLQTTVIYGHPAIAQAALTPTTCPSHHPTPPLTPSVIFLFLFLLLSSPPASPSSLLEVAVGWSSGCPLPNAAQQVSRRARFMGTIKMLMITGQEYVN